MGRMTPNDADILSRVDSDTRGYVLFLYLHEKKGQAFIGERVFSTEGSFAGEPVSVITRAYGFHGKGMAGKYRSVPEQAFYDFAAEFKPEKRYGGLDEGTFDRWLRDWYARQAEDEEDDEDDFYVEIPQPTPRPTPTPPRPPRPSPTPSLHHNYDPTDFPDPPTRKVTYVSTGNGASRFAPILGLVLIVLLIWGVGKVVDFGRGAISAGKGALEQVNSFLEAEYTCEIFEYEGFEFVGNQRFNKPDGVCMKMRGLDYTIGYFESGQLNGFAVATVDDFDQVDMGIFKDGRLSGCGIHRFDHTTYIGDFKKGVPSGYGYRVTGNREQIVKFKSVQERVLLYGESQLEVIAEKQEGQWLKPNGKPLKLKDNTYKGMEFLSDGRIRIDELTITLAEDGSLSYICEEVKLIYSSTECSYDSILEDDEGTSMYYTHDETHAGNVEGEHRFKAKDGTHWKTFSAEITIS